MAFVVISKEHAGTTFRHGGHSYTFDNEGQLQFSSSEWEKVKELLRTVGFTLVRKPNKEKEDGI